MKYRHVLVTMTSIELAKLDIKNSYGIENLAYPSLDSDILLSSIFHLQENMRHISLDMTLT